MAYVGSTNDVLRAERTASLKNDVLNLLRSQNPVPAGLTELLVGMFRTGNHPPAVLDYCLQHLGAMQDDVVDVTLRDRIRAVLVGAAKRIRFPYAGTALYSLAACRMWRVMSCRDVVCAGSRVVGAGRATSRGAAGRDCVR
ncbi:MAG: hypothetical protein IKO72_08045 [Kiritimatiellae bacterium]|nr:hypothetical protein [Kiritimatiellia bacterium]